MKVKAIKFFTPQENTPKTDKVKAQPKLTGYISAAGKLVLPSGTIEQLGIQPDATRFKIGAQEGKRKLKFLYLIPSSDHSASFALVKSRRGYVIPLEIILKNGGVDYANSKYTFTISTFDYEEGVQGYELALNDSEPKPEYTGKPRGRKAKVETPVE
jgi:hypothetical protein